MYTIVVVYNSVLGLPRFSLKPPWATGSSPRLLLLVQVFFAVFAFMFFAVFSSFRFWTTSTAVGSVVGSAVGTVVEGEFKMVPMVRMIGLGLS
jgi:hypothetical protein